MCGHVGTKGSYFFRKTIRESDTQTLEPVSQCSLDRLEELLDVFIGEFLRERERRKTSFEEDLVRVSVADATEYARIGEGAF